MKPGRVYLVGAGPGDPGLLTLRGRECIEEADVVLYDDLVDRRLLRFARPGTELVAMGKRGGGAERDRQQRAIDERMVEEARAGRTVVRLKGGDPFVFGRGGEEAQTLGGAGIDFEIVPGVSSAIAVPAYAGIPVTHRGLNSSFTVVTGHEAPGAASRLDWEALARMETLVFLMSLRRLGEIASRLIGAGLSADTPAACIRLGTRPDQRVVCAALGEIAARVEAAGWTPPALLVVGEVVKLREGLRWFENRPLFGRRVLVTRAAEQGSSLRDRLERLGAEVIDGATVRIAPPESDAPLDQAIDDLGSFDWLVFTSRKGVERFFERFLARGGDWRDLRGARLAAVGPATAVALRERGLRVDVQPEEFRGEELGEALSTAVKGARVLLARAAGAGDVLPQRLRGSGAEVVDAATHRSERVSRLSAAAIEALREGRVDVVMLTSSSTATALVALLRSEGLTLGQARVACIGPVTAAAARELGLEVEVEAERHTVDGMIEALVDYFGGRS